MFLPLLGVWLLALVLRCLYVWQISHAPFYDLRIGDAEAYHAWAQRIAAGDWMGRDVFYQAPLYPYFLAAIYKIFGDGVTTVRLVQAFIGAGSCALVAAAGMSLFGPAGAIAGAMLAVYPSAIFLDGLLEKSSLVTFFTAALLFLVATPSDASPGNWKSRRRWFATGVVLGLLALTRENALLLVVPVLLWVASKRDRESLSTKSGQTTRDLVSVVAFVAGCALVLLPVALRNYAVGHEFHLTTSQFGPNFYIGNHAGAKGTYEPLVVGHGSAADERDDATRLAEQTAGRTLSPDEVSSFWTRRSLEYIRSEPAAWLTQLGRKLALTFNAAAISDTESQDVYADWSSLLRLLAPFSFGFLFALAVFGTALTAHDWRRLWFLYAIGATYALSVVIFYVFERYRFPLVPVLMILAAGGLAEMWRKRLPDLVSWRTVGAAGAAMMALAFSHLHLEDSRGFRMTHYVDIANMLSRDPARADQAMEYYQRIFNEVPQFPAAHFGIGTLLARLGRPQDAIPHYRAALETWPDEAELRYNLGLALLATGQTQDALDQMNDAIRIRPDDPDMHIALGKVLIALQRPGEAVEQYRLGLSIQPKNVTALVGLGVALTQIGRPQEAIEQYQRALELDPMNVAAYDSLGATLANSGRIAEAIPQFERAVELSPNDENAKRNLEQARQLMRAPAGR